MSALGSRSFSRILRCYSQPALFISLLSAATQLIACGGGGSNTSSTPPAAATYTVALSPTAITLTPAAKQNLTVTTQSTNGFSGVVTFGFSGVPSGVTATPSTFTINGAGSQTVVMAMTSSAAAGTAVVTVSGSSGSVQQKATLTLTLKAPVAPPPPPSFAGFPDAIIPTNPTTPYESFPAPNWLVYHAATNRFFATDPYLNHLNVIDAASRTLISTLIIPGAFGLDQAPDGSVLYVGTMIGDLYVVDPVKLTIKQRYPTASISPYGFAANAVYALADGKLVLETTLLLPEFSYVDGNGPLALWNPGDNSIVEFTNDSGTQVPAAATCLEKFQNVLLTNNRTRVLLSPVQTSDGSSYLCSLDPETDTWNWSQQLAGGVQSAFTAFALTSDGATVYAYDGFNVYALNAATLALENSFAVSTGQMLFSYPNMFLSLDNKTLFLTDANGPDVLDGYDVSTGKLSTWISDPVVVSVQPIYQAVSSSGLVAGVIEGAGIGVVDTTAVKPLPIGSRFLQTELNIPYGPAGGGTSVNWLPSSFGVPAATLSSVYFGLNTATGAGETSSGDIMISAVTPAGSPGPVDVRTFASDGGSQLLPAGFSYGPWVLESPTNYATAEGGGPGSLYGYGFGPQKPDGGAATYPPPSDLNVTVGGASAKVNSYDPDPYYTLNSAAIQPSNALLYTVPAGSAGSSVSIVVTNAAGTHTTSAGLNYLPPLQQYPVSGQLADGIYDPGRDVYYFSDASQVRVFSLAQKAWLPSIPIPAPKGAYGPQRLLGLALSLDGTKLAISDPGAIAIYIVNPDQPSSIQSFPYASQISDPVTESPSGIAILNNGTVYFSTFDLNGDGYYLYTLNPSTGQVAYSGGILGSLGSEGPYLDGRLAISADGSRIYFNDASILGWIDTASGQTVLPEASVSGLIEAEASLNFELALCANQTRIFTDGFMTDSNLNILGIQALDLAQALDAEYVYGAALSTDGGLVFQPGTQFIDVFDGNTGAFRDRISLPTPLSPNYRALVSNGRDSTLVAITGTAGNGIAVMDLNSLPEPTPLPYLSSRPGPVAARVSPSPASRVLSKTKVIATLPMARRIRREPSPLIQTLRAQRAAISPFR
jgi:hypothetical protein